MRERSGSSWLDTSSYLTGMRDAPQSKCSVTPVVLGCPCSIVRHRNFPGKHGVRRGSSRARRVLILHSFGPRFKPWSDYAETIRSEINRHRASPWTLSTNALVNARVSDVQSEAPFVEYLSALYAGHPLDLIIAFGGPAATFVQQHRQRLFPRVPMVVTAVDHRRVQYEKLTENDAVVPVTNDLPAVFENIMQVLPRTKTIAILIGASPIERFWTEECAGARAIG